MDQAVLDAISRWPNVPAVYGWLSLSKRGQWRLHPNGTAQSGAFGETIHNQQILSFMDRNYDRDEQGRWFFQNGPQRVFVRLDAAPYIVSVTGQPPVFRTHNQKTVKQIHRWFIDTEGQLYILCEHGPAMICDQDLEIVANALQTESGLNLLDWWSSEPVSSATQTTVQFVASSSLAAIDVQHQNVPLERLSSGQSIDQRLGFVMCPQP